MARLSQLLGVVLRDPEAERVRRSHDFAIRELQRYVRQLLEASADSLLALAHVQSGGTFYQAGAGEAQLGCESVSKTATGTYDIVLASSWRAEDVVFFATPFASTARRATISTVTASTRTVTVKVTDSAGATQDTAFFFQGFKVR